MFGEERKKWQIEGSEKPLKVTFPPQASQGHKAPHRSQWVISATYTGRGPCSVPWILTFTVRLYFVHIG